ncbi:hypothetical protein GCM10027073_59660 [Streptomyces chlorus]
MLFVRGERPVVVDEADATVELGVAGEALLDAGHADEDHADAGAVVVVPELFQARGLEAVGFVDDEEFGVAGGSCREVRCRVRSAEAAVVDELDGVVEAVLVEGNRLLHAAWGVVDL